MRYKIIYNTDTIEIKNNKVYAVVKELKKINKEWKVVKKLKRLFPDIKNAIG